MALPPAFVLLLLTVDEWHVAAGLSWARMKLALSISQFYWVSSAAIPPTFAKSLCMLEWFVLIKVIHKGTCHFPFHLWINCFMTAADAVVAP